MHRLVSMRLNARLKWLFEREAINSSSRGTQDSIRMSLRRPNNNRGWRYMCKSSRGSSLLVEEEEELAHIASGNC